MLIYEVGVLRERWSLSVVLEWW